MKNNRGFTVVEGLLILVIVGMLGYVGWYVWNTNNKTLDTLADTDAANSSVAIKSTAQKDPTADWVKYSSKAGQFSLKYPASWVKAFPVESCETDDSLLLLGANNSSVGAHCSDSGGQMAVIANNGDLRSSLKLESNLTLTDIKTEEVKIDGVVGIKQTGTFKEHSEFGNFDVGDKEVQYTFYTNGKTYTLSYLTAKNYPDALSDFNLMVIKTLKFSS